LHSRFLPKRSRRCSRPTRLPKGQLSGPAGEHIAHRIHKADFCHARGRAALLFCTFVYLRASRRTATVLQPGWYRPVRNGQTHPAKAPKTIQTSPITGHTRTGCNRRHRIVALEEVAGSSPVGHPLQNFGNPKKSIQAGIAMSRLQLSKMLQCELRRTPLLGTWVNDMCDDGCGVPADSTGRRSPQEIRLAPRPSHRCPGPANEPARPLRSAGHTLSGGLQAQSSPPILLRKAP
jgi:hypothetical protein